MLGSLCNICSSTSELKIKSLPIRTCMTSSMLLCHTQHDSGMLSASMTSHVEPRLRAALTWCEVIYFGEPPWGSAHSCHMVPIHLRPPSWRPRGVETSHVRALLLSHMGPQLRFSIQWKDDFFPVNHHGAQHAPVVWPPFTFRHYYGPVSSFPPHACAETKVVAVGNEEVGLPI
jgi:hypothetical protein